MFILAQLIRFLSAVFEFIADGTNNKKHIYLYNGIYNFLAAVSYFMLNAVSGGIGCLAAILRNFLFYKSKNKVNIFILLGYLLFVFILTLLDAPNIIAFIPFILVLLYTLGLYSNNVTYIKYSILIVDVLEIIYDYIVLSYAGIIICLIDFVIVFISLFFNKKEGI